MFGFFKPNFYLRTNVSEFIFYVPKSCYKTVFNSSWRFKGLPLVDATCVLGTLRGGLRRAAALKRKFKRTSQVDFVLASRGSCAARRRLGHESVILSGESQESWSECHVSEGIWQSNLMWVGFGDAIAVVIGFTMWCFFCKNR